MEHNDIVNVIWTKEKGKAGLSFFIFLSTLYWHCHLFDMDQLFLEYS